jgi:hypothetical protein
MCLPPFGMRIGACQPSLFVISFHDGLAALLAFEEGTDVNNRCNIVL